MYKIIEMHIEWKKEMLMKLNSFKCIMFTNIN